jgi:NADH:ubiquinone oxidoreductase subunit 6 (subunit J)
MNLAAIGFYFFVISAISAALAILFSKNVFKAALWLLVCLLSIASLFIMSFAEFVAITQILIYAGGLLVVILFGIMFTSKLASKPLRVENTNLFAGLLAGGLVFALLSKLIVKHLPQGNNITRKPEHAIEIIGEYLMMDYSLPFEVIGILLLIALIGASVITAFMKLKRHD